MKSSPLQRKTPIRRSAPGRTKQVLRCKQCGCEFSVLPVRRLTARYCSRACTYLGRQAQSNTKKPISDRKGDREWQKAVRERDGYCCQRCGRYDVHIHTHHVATRAQRPDLRHEVSNGKCLCSTCHGWVHNNPIEAQELGLLSSARYELECLAVRREAIQARQHSLDDLREDILRLTETGLRPDAVARELGCSRTPVDRILREARMSTYRSGRPNNSSLKQLEK